MALEKSTSQMKMYVLLKIGGMIQCHVSFQGCIGFYHVLHVCSSYPWEEMGRLFSEQILLEFRLYPIQIIGSSDSLFPNKTNQPSSNMDATIFWNLLFLHPINQTLQVFDVYLQWFPSCSSLKSLPFNFLAALTYQSQEFCQATQVHPSSAQPPAMTPHLWISSAAVVKPPALRRTAPGDLNMVILGGNLSNKNMFFWIFLTPKTLKHQLSIVCVDTNN